MSLKVHALSKAPMKTAGPLRRSIRLVETSPRRLYLLLFERRMPAIYTPYAHALLGKTYAEMGRTQDAIAELKLGSESDQDGTVHYQLARMYLSIGDNSDAAAALEQMKAIQQRRRELAVIETQEEHLSALEESPWRAACL